MRHFLVALALLSTGCAPQLAPEEGVSVRLAEFRVEAAGTFVAGSNLITVSNDGKFGHTLVVADRDGDVVAASPVVGPGDRIEFTLDLSPGIYELSCRMVIQTEEGRLVDHYEEGMIATIEVGEPA